MNIPDKAVLEGAKAIYRDYGEPVDDRVLNYAKTILEAAAPFIAAQALRDYADVVSDGRISFRDSEARGLRDRAKWLEAGA